MRLYVCMFCRQELYKEGEEEKQCEHHPDGPVDYINIEDVRKENEAVE